MNICKIRLRGKKPSNPAYPTELNTLGDHLRKARLDRGLSQSDVARLLQVTTDTVTGWEMNRHGPTPKQAKAVINFLGYFPFMDGASLGQQLYHARLVSGKTQEEVAKVIGCDESNLRLIERDERKPQPATSQKIREFIDGSLADSGSNALIPNKENWGFHTLTWHENPNVP